MQQSSSNHWHLLGAGAIGTLFASALHRDGGSATLVVRDATALQQRRVLGPLTVSGQQPPFEFSPDYSAASDPAPIARLLVTTKAYQCLDALASVAHRLQPDSLVVLLHNGYGPQQQAAARWPELRIYAGTTTEGAFRSAPNHLHHAGRGQTWFGPITPAAAAAGSAPLSNLLDLSLGCGYDPAITTRLWQKLAINAAINGLTVVHDCRNGELASNPDYRAEMAALCNETEALAAALQQPLFEQPLLEVTFSVAAATAANYSSMLQDVRHGRPTELAEINGTLCRLGDEIGLPLPAHRQLIAAVRRRSQQTH
ncbi:MAG TPA: 2-dehydropantoate 2-reductase [Motiliproteus sp.]